jgi:hypothetical protein
MLQPQVFVPHFGCLYKLYWNAIIQDLSHFHNKPAVEIINSLNVRGQLFHAHQGKEFIFSINNVGGAVWVDIEEVHTDNLQTVLHIGLVLEAHCLWIPMTMYQTIVSRKL